MWNGVQHFPTVLRTTSCLDWKFVFQKAFQKAWINFFCKCFYPMVFDLQKSFIWSVICIIWDSSAPDANHSLFVISFVLHHRFLPTNDSIHFGRSKVGSSLVSRWKEDQNEFLKTVLFPSTSCDTKFFPNSPFHRSTSSNWSFFRFNDFYGNRGGFDADGKDFYATLSTFLISWEIKCSIELETSSLSEVWWLDWSSPKLITGTELAGQ